MDGLAVTGFVFGMSGFVFGLMAFVRLEALTKALKEKGVLDEQYQPED
jgi:hypothetical protein